MADLNSLIAQGVQFKAPPDPFAQFAQMQQIQQGQQANQLNQMKMQEYQRGIESQNALRASPAPEGVNPQHWAIDPMEALKIQKSNAEAVNLGFTGKKTQAEIATTKQKMIAQARRDISQNPSDAQLTAHLEDTMGSDLFTSAEKNQASVRHQELLAMPYEKRKSVLAASGATAGDLSTAATAKAGQDITIRGQDLTAATAKAGQGITLRGQNMTAATAQAGQNLTNQRAIDTLAQGKVPTGYRAVTGGGVEPIPGGPASGDKALTESQGNATAYGMRMHEANKTLNDLEGKGEKNTGVISGAVGGLAGMIPLIGDKLQGATGSLFNALPEIMGGLSPEQQQVAQARINFITAQLRKESGASIAPSEFITAEKMYFPKPGDTQAVIDAKSKTRKTAIEAMKVQAGPGAKHIGSMAGTEPSTDPLGLR